MNIHDHKGIQNFLDYLGLSLSYDKFEPRYNVAPGAELEVVVGEESPSLQRMKWGITPPWASKQKGVRDLINARAETVWEKPSFRRLIPGNRCIVPVNGFFEWQRADGKKIPFNFHGADTPAFGIAGIFQRDSEGAGQVCLLTTAANAVMVPVHDRMPVIVEPQNLQTWLSHASRAEIEPLLLPVGDDFLTLCPVSSYVNNAGNTGPECVKCLESVQ